MQRDLDLADTVGVQGTPSTIVGNQGFEAPNYETLEEAIDQQLSGSQDKGHVRLVMKTHLS